MKEASRSTSSDNSVVLEQLTINDLKKLLKDKIKNSKGKQKFPKPG